ncbi:uncharacterized protein [Palaemon carinicauda]|uniref:uncharacterized protein n=1 Tax=Palaemon carinicauda TaxID=392227 RepID=UPI0035B58D73
MDRNLSRSFGAGGGRRYRYSGAHTTALDSVTVASPPEMSYTARKYSGTSYGTTGRRNSSFDRDTSKASSSIGGRPTSGYSSYLTSVSAAPSSYSSLRRGNASIDYKSGNLDSSPSSYSSRLGSQSARSNYFSSGSLGTTVSKGGSCSNSRYSSNNDLSGYDSRYSAERNVDQGSLSSGRGSRQSSVELTSSPNRYSRGSSLDLNSSATPSVGTRCYSRLSNCTESYSSSGRASRHNSGELPLTVNSSTPTIGKYSRQNSAEMSSSPSPTPSTFVNGYATLERRTNRRKREYLAERRSAERIGNYSSSNVELKRYTRTYSCDLHDRRNATRDYSLPTKNGTTSSGSGQGDQKEGSRPPSVDRERSPSVVAIYEGLARINDALKRHGAKGTPLGLSASKTIGSSSMSSHNSALNGRPTSHYSSTTDLDQCKTSVSSTACTTPTSYSSSTSLDQGVIKDALGGYLSPKVKSPRSRTNNFTSGRDSVESQINLVPDIVIPVSCITSSHAASCGRLTYLVFVLNLDMNFVFNGILNVVTFSSNSLLRIK